MAHEAGCGQGGLERRQTHLYPPAHLGSIQVKVNIKGSTEGKVQSKGHCMVKVRNKGQGQFPVFASFELGRAGYQECFRLTVVET